MLALCAALALAVGVGAVGAVAEANGDQPTISKKKKKKCKIKPASDRKVYAPAVKCAPDGYHLSASGTIELPGAWVEAWSAEVDLARQSLNACHLICYTQDGGSLTLGVTGNVHCGWGPGGTLNVPSQTLALSPVQDPQGSDFYFSFDHVTGEFYGGSTGLPYETLLEANGTTYCPPGPNGEPEETMQITWTHHYSVIAEDGGKVGKTLSGTTTYETSETVVHSLHWELTPEK